MRQRERESTRARERAREREKRGQRGEEEEGEEEVQIKRMRRTREEILDGAGSMHLGSPDWATVRVVCTSSNNDWMDCELPTARFPIRAKATSTNTNTKAISTQDGQSVELRRGRQRSMRLRGGTRGDAGADR